MKRLVQVVVTIATLCVGTAAMANEAAATAASGSNGSGMAYAYAAAIAIGIAAFGGALGQGMGIFSALGSIGRNPSAANKITTPMIIGLAMIESLVIYALVIALMLVLKI